MAETIEERRERKRIAAERLVNADKIYFDKVFKTYLPFLVGIRDGTCTGINTSNKTVTVKLDPSSNNTQQSTVSASWDRPKLTASQVVGKRVKVYTPREENELPVLAAITSS